MALRTTPEIRAAVERLAEAEARTMAAIVERLIVEALAARYSVPSFAEVAKEDSTATVEAFRAQRTKRAVQEAVDAIVSKDKATRR